MADEASNTNGAPGIPQLAVAEEAAPDDAQNEAMARDVVMTEAQPDQPASSPAAQASLAPSPAPARTGTPAQGSRAASAHPDPGFSMPSEAPPHGDPTRRYLNTKVTGVVLEGMRNLAKEQPSDPLRVLGEYLLQRSKELEETS